MVFARELQRTFRATYICYLPSKPLHVRPPSMESKTRISTAYWMTWMSPLSPSSQRIDFAVEFKMLPSRAQDVNNACAPSLEYSPNKARVSLLTIAYLVQGYILAAAYYAAHVLCHIDHTGVGVETRSSRCSRRSGNCSTFFHARHLWWMEPYVVLWRLCCQ